MKIFAIFMLLTLQLFAFSTTNLQYLYGNFEGETFLDTQNGAKQTVTLEHYRTWDYGDIYAFGEYVHAKDGMRFSNLKDDYYGEISPRLSINKIADITVSNGLFKEWYAAFQHNRGRDYRGWLYGAGVDLNIPAFSTFGVNLYKKVQNIGKDTYQLSLNYYLPLIDKWHFEGFVDYTGIDFLTQNQLLYNIAPIFGVTQQKFEAGVEWHYYHENTAHKENSVFQAMVKLTF